MMSHSSRLSPSVSRMRAAISFFLVLPAILLVAPLCTANERLSLENSLIEMTFDPATGLISSVGNKLTGETLDISEEGFWVETEGFTLEPKKMTLQSLQRLSPESLEAIYLSSGYEVKSTYTLRQPDHFLTKKLSLRSSTPFGWKNVVVSRMKFPEQDFVLFRYPHQKTVTWFGRTTKGGIFTGMEMPFDNSEQWGRTLSLGYAPSLKVKANEWLESEPVYLGVYKRRGLDQEELGLPLQSESTAMVAMTTKLLGPPRHSFAPAACGYWCEMEHFEYKDEAALESDLRVLDLIKEVGIDWVTDNIPWGGEIELMNSLRLNDRYQPGPIASKKYEYAQRIGLKMAFWPTMNNSNPWWEKKGRPFLPDIPEWTMFPERRRLKGTFLSGKFFFQNIQGNCIANKPFRDWINQLSLDGMKTGYFPSWVMDGDFFGGGGVITRVECPKKDHDHLYGDATYACDRALRELIENVRKLKPDTYITVCRPPMDQGVFSQHNVDAVFTIDELSEPEALPGLTGQPVNMVLGDKIRRWSRIRVHHHFFPHYIDWPQVFVGPPLMGPPHGRPWTSEAIDYIMLSAISSSPNQLYYLPAKSGLPEADKREIKKWLDWGRAHAAYLMVRQDLPDWPQAGKIDGSAHLLGDHGYLFLFNPNPEPQPAHFSLDESIGLTQGTSFSITAVYPDSKLKAGLLRGSPVSWIIPPRTATILSIKPD